MSAPLAFPQPAAPSSVALNVDAVRLVHNLIIGAVERPFVKRLIRRRYVLSLNRTPQLMSRVWIQNTTLWRRQRHKSMCAGREPFTTSARFDLFAGELPEHREELVGTAPLPAVPEGCCTDPGGCHEEPRHEIHFHRDTPPTLSFHHSSRVKKYSLEWCLAHATTSTATQRSTTPPGEAWRAVLLRPISRSPIFQPIAITTGQPHIQRRSAYAVPCA